MNWLIELRKSKSLKAVEIARELDISRARYCNIEKGRERPTIAQAKRIGKLLGFDWTKFYEDIE